MQIIRYLNGVPLSGAMPPLVPALPPAAPACSIAAPRALCYTEGGGRDPGKGKP